MERELPKLRGIERYEKETGEKVKLIIPDSPPEYVYEALDIIGRDDYIEWDGGPLSVDRLVVPSYPQPYPTTLKWIRNALEGDTIKSPINSDWIYISRQRAEKGRQVDNYSEVVQVLEEYGVEPVFLEDMSLQEQIATFQQVDGIIGPHGAGLVGMIWTEELSIIEVFNNVINTPFYILADILGHDYTALTGEGIGEFSHQKDQNIILDVSELEQRMKSRM
jgi:capsular polysaccharide biosynthesis protein